MRGYLIAAVIVLLPQLGLADEFWNSQQYGRITYESDLGDVAIFSMAGGHPGSRVMMYIPGLGGNYSDRGTYEGYWIETAPGECSSERTAPDGTISDMWGKVRIIFDKPSFPSGFTASLGSCDGDYTDEMLAEPS